MFRTGGGERFYSYEIKTVFFEVEYRPFELGRAVEIHRIGDICDGEGGCESADAPIS